MGPLWVSHWVEEGKKLSYNCKTKFDTGGSVGNVDIAWRTALTMADSDEIIILGSKRLLKFMIWYDWCSCGQGRIAYSVTVCLRKTWQLASLIIWTQNIQSNLGDQKSDQKNLEKRETDRQIQRRLVFEALHDNLPPYLPNRVYFFPRISFHCHFSVMFFCKTYINYPL